MRIKAVHRQCQQIGIQSRCTSRIQPRVIDVPEELLRYRCHLDHKESTVRRLEIECIRMVAREEELKAIAYRHRGQVLLVDANL